MNQKEETRKRARTLKMIRNFGFLTSGKTLSDVFTFILFIALSRVYGQEGIGQYSFAIAFTGIFAMFSHFGLYQLAVKELSRRTDTFSDYNGAIFSLRLVLTLASAGIMLAIIPFLPFDGQTKLVLIIIGVFQFGYRIADGIAAVFVAREDTHLAGLLEVFLRVVSTLLAVYIILAGGSILLALTALPVVVVFQFVAAYWIAARKYGRPRLVLSPPSLLRVMRDAIPYGSSFVLMELRWRVNIVILGFFVSTAAAGLYNVGFRVVFLLMFISEFASMAIFPQASQLWLKSHDEFRQLYHSTLRLMVLFGLPIAAGVWLLAPDAIQIVFGPEFSESAVILRILASLVLLTFLSRTMEVFLMSGDHQAERAKSQWVAAGVSLVGNLALIPFFGIVGAAVAMLLAEIVFVVLLILYLKPLTGWPQIGSSTLIGITGVASFLLPFFFLPSFSPTVVIPASIILYLTILVAFKEIRAGEIRTLISLVKRE